MPWSSGPRSKEASASRIAEPARARSSGARIVSTTSSSRPSPGGPGARSADPLRRPSPAVGRRCFDTARRAGSGLDPGVDPGARSGFAGGGPGGTVRVRGGRIASSPPVSTEPRSPTSYSRSRLVSRGFACTASSGSSNGRKSRSIRVWRPDRGSERSEPAPSGSRVRAGADDRGRSGRPDARCAERAPATPPASARDPRARPGE